ncbi:MAG: GTPase Era [Malacoplasma sp.]|nr:GTPase Era [Mycoplasmataceae bacterium]MDY2887760.1 GTPase Era [Malacoplasma sp.]
MKIKTGTVVITGKPNVGKSTLINTIANKLIAITSPKPQTTRNKIKFTYNDDKNKIAFIDTPGYHIPNNKLDMFLNSEIKNAYKLADIALLVIDLTREIDQEDIEVINIIKSYNVKKVILVLNKIDVAKQGIDQKYEAKVKELIEISQVIKICANKIESVKEVIDTIHNHLDDNNDLVEDVEIADNFFISEIIREQIIFNFKQEVPYATCIAIRKKNYDPNTNVFEIYADIVVEKESQKPIIIGAKGQMIKKIGTKSREKLLEFYDCKIVLHLFVVTKKDWRNDTTFLKENGYYR